MGMCMVSAIWGPTLPSSFYVFSQCVDADDKILCPCLFPHLIHPKLVQLIEEMLWSFSQQSAWLDALTDPSSSIINLEVT